MLISIALKLLGGLWAVKEKCNSAGFALIKKIYLYIYYRALLKRNSWIGHTAEFDSVPTFPHLNGVFISSGAKIGKGCVIYHNVTIGSNTLPDSSSFGSPTIGRNCFFGAGASVIGNVTIGDNVRVGAGCAVSMDVPTNSVVVPQPPRIIKKDRVDNRFYNKLGGKWVYHEEGKKIEVTDENILRTLEQRNTDKL